MAYIIKRGNIQERFCSPGKAYESYVRDVLHYPKKQIVIEREKRGKTMPMSRLELETEVLRAAEPMSILSYLTSEQLDILISQK